MASALASTIDDIWNSCVWRNVRDWSLLRFLDGVPTAQGLSSVPASPSHGSQHSACPKSCNANIEESCAHGEFAEIRDSRMPMEQPQGPVCRARTRRVGLTFLRHRVLRNPVAQLLSVSTFSPQITCECAAWRSGTWLGRKLARFEAVAAVRVLDVFSGLITGYFKPLFQ